MIAIIDYGMGNVGSIKNILRKIGYSSRIVTQPQELEGAKLLILPGVGSFDNAVEKLTNSGLFDKIRGMTLSGEAKLLGICLGMHLLARSSEEGKKTGLDLIPGRVLKFNKNKDNFKIPHMGWNNVTVDAEIGCLLKFDKSRFYFVHSYYFKCDEPALSSIGSTEYSIKFTSIVQSGNITGVQFHPEKSHRFGMEFFTNYLSLNYD